MSDDRIDRIRKLLAQADSVAGTPEADIFNQKAFELIAKYGVDEAEVRRVSGSGPAEIIVYEIEISGAYKVDRGLLFNALAGALHCSSIRVSKSDRRKVFGTAANIERLKLLFALLSVQMNAGAAKVKGVSASSTSRARRSWMLGFIHAVSTRLEVAEKDAAYDIVGSDLVHVNDADRAAAALRLEYPNIRQLKVRRNVDGRAHADGANAGGRADIGNARMSSRRALTR